MTGFGEVIQQRGGYAIAVELRTVNNRYFKLNIRTTEGYSSLESLIESALRETVKRGTVSCNLRIRHLASAEDFRLNTRVLHQYVDQLQEVAAKRNLDEMIRLEPLASLPGVVEELSTESLDAAGLWPLVEPALRGAIEQLTKMRTAEGEALAVDLNDQCNTVAACLEVIEKQAPLVGESYRKRIQDRVNEALSSLNVTLEPTDLVREVALYTDRADISEEIVRLRSHLQQFGEAQKLPESAGRKMEFICQEMGRETNTIGSKANDALISQQIVEIKTALERIREQIQNVQ
ncbi:Conserved hypothetical protein CHP00255 [Bythopirellula polymerisocia]|uniref:YicC-like family, N-terminal region n=2 Tax=Bythopirellula polymerisocia TaxID=2528003 RepID=A0A5C6CNL7_9BACT|nr:Conserved hypothetical protein CHP00255 [Bythopirellula polymerisocia]